MIKEGNRAVLLLENGMEFVGKSFGKQGTVIGETVFSTGMTGFEETLTDPSYYGQLVTQTFPLVGNYGINSFDKESRRCHLYGYIVREWCETPSNFRCESDLDTFLKKQNVIGLYDIDTRRLTKVIRESGVMNGMITTEEITDKDEALKQIKAYKIKDAVKTVSATGIRHYAGENPKRKVVLYDFGYKYNIRENLRKRGCDVVLVPWNTTAEEIKEINPDGIMLSNGPGDPKENIQIIENLKEVFKLGIPTFGICLGHQLTALANGADTAKLKYGHRGANQPVIDKDHNRTFVTSQNHGYAVVNESIDSNIGYVSHINANDGSCEGVKYKNMPVFTVQFHPEACSGPKDTAYLFNEFITMMDREGK